ncbi:SGNH/GDSL hydrolase family protein [Parendozoicomonas haliclonae]|uniref:GDSL-like Lipase/Acylhydrolase n=1 Tax=Parendozoicomonas haliclonae TaxID=1960125 RepID=A0A1X7AE01_9GAMM|nr:SGNH/GDSL hydrolase family protein [Parendozoicomonas haliclonae]SMA31704.1 GDSL-like Lipase/Acylhydrolase [Parendozoicomonas haliclonae]
MRFVVTLVLILFSSFVGATTSAGIVVFGDSLSDQGNNCWCEDDGRSGKSKGAPLTNWPGVPLERNHGVVWFQYLSKKQYGVDSVPSSQAVPEDLAINAAWASAETGDNYLNDLAGAPFPVGENCNGAGLFAGYSCVPGVLRQVQLFLASDVKSKKERQYLIFAGGNDVIDNILRIEQWAKREKDKLSYYFNLAGGIANLLNEKQADASSGHQQLDFPISNTISAVNLLVKAGVPKSNIAVMNLPDLSRTPIGHELTSGKPFLNKLLKGFCSGYDKVLKVEMVLAGFSEVKVIDIYSWLNEVLDNKDANHFVYGAETSCVAAHKQEACDGYFFFNGKHPTTQIGHRLLGEWVAGQL